MKKKTKTKKLDHECEHAVKTLTIHYGLGHIMSTRKAPRLLGWWFRRAWQYNLGIPGYLSSLKDFFAVMSHIEMQSALVDLSTRRAFLTICHSFQMQWLCIIWISLCARDDTQNPLLRFLHRSWPTVLRFGIKMVRYDMLSLSIF